MPQPALPDLGEVVAQIDKLQAADRRPLHLLARGSSRQRCSGGPVVALCGGEVQLRVKQKDARLMYALQQSTRGVQQHEEIFFELTDADNAIEFLVALAKIPSGSESYLRVSVVNDNGAQLASLNVKIETKTFAVAQSQVGEMLRRMLTIVKSAVSPEEVNQVMMLSKARRH